MKLSTFRPFLFTIALALVDATQQVITDPRLPSDIQPYAVKTVVPISLTVPGSLQVLRGSVNVSIDDGGTFQTGLYLERFDEPLKISRTVNFTARNQATAGLVDTPCTTYIVHLSPIVAGVPVTIPISFPIPGSNETASGNTTIRLDSSSKLGLATSIAGDSRKVGFSDGIEIRFPRLLLRNLLLPSVPVRYCKTDAGTAHAIMAAAANSRSVRATRIAVGNTSTPNANA